MWRLSPAQSRAMWPVEVKVYFVFIRLHQRRPLILLDYTFMSYCHMETRWSSICSVACRCLLCKSTESLKKEILAKRLKKEHNANNLVNMLTIDSTASKNLPTTYPALSSSMQADSTHRPQATSSGPAPTRHDVVLHQLVTHRRLQARPRYSRCSRHPHPYYPHRSPSFL